MKPMMLYTRKTSPLLAALAFAALLACPMAGMAKPQDLLERPAEMHPRVESSVFLSVVRAGKRLVAVGEQGRIVLSDDNGASWKQVPSPTSVTLTAVHFAGDKQGWAVGHSGIVLHSTDGGQTWEKQLDGVQAAKLHGAGVQALGSDTPNLPAQQRNAQQLLADGADKPFLDVYFENENKGWIIGAYGIAFTTNNGGKQWETIIPGITNPKSRHLYSVRPVADKRYVVGEQGTLLVNEGDKRFSAIPSPYNGTYFGVISGNQRELVLYGLRGNVFWSGNEGRDWKKVEVGSAVTLTAATRLDNGNLLLADETGRVLRSTDGGQNFTAEPIAKAAYITGITQASDGSIILATNRGLFRTAPAAAQKDSK
ncbi:MAG: hypothetical protein HGA71_17685 [Azonexaceae bacterium]|nr:hypothetical protein [Azonexaceae bacterium]